MMELTYRWWNRPLTLITFLLVCQGVFAKTEVNSALIRGLKAKAAIQKNSKRTQKSFWNALARGDNERALGEWFATFAGKAFARTSHGKALLAYLLFNNRLEVLGVRTLFTVKNPKTVHKRLRSLWKSMAPAQHQVWRLAQVRWKTAWSNFFDQETAAVVGSSSLGTALNKDQILSLLKRMKPHSAARAKLEFQLALNLALKGRSNAARAIKILDRLLKTPNGHVDKNLVLLTAARIWYPQGRWDQAIQHYRGVSKSSEYWFTAQEEMAWAYIAKRQPQKALTITNTLMLQNFMPHVGPETVFLNAFSQLKTCDYFGVEKSIDIFKTRFKKRTQALMQTAGKGLAKDKGIMALFDRPKQGRVELFSLGDQAFGLPRYVSRDEVLFQQAQIAKALQQETAQLGQLRTKYSAITGKRRASGIKAIKNLANSLKSRSKKIKRSFSRQIKKLAGEEIAEIKQVLLKMHILEAELIQQVATIIQGGRMKTVATVTKQQSGDQKTDTVGDSGQYDLKFPFTGEIWFDELNNYKSNLKEICQAGGVN